LLYVGRAATPRFAMRAGFDPYIGRHPRELPTTLATT